MNKNRSGLLNVYADLRVFTIVMENISVAFQYSYCVHIMYLLGVKECRKKTFKFIHFLGSIKNSRQEEMILQYEDSNAVC